MLRMRYSNELQYQWAEIFVKLCGGIFETKKPQFSPETLEIHIDHSQIEPLFQRASDPQQVAILPSILGKTSKDKRDRWLVIGPDRQMLEQAVNRMRHFLVPTYAIFADDPIVKFHDFVDKDKLVFRLAAQVYPRGGYCILQSRQEEVSRVLERLNVWLQLEADRPVPQQEDLPPTYLALHERFQLTLATAQWDEATEIRDRIRSNHLTTADNLRFLEIEQWAVQQRWQDIREDQDFKQLARTRIPRNVRGALLTAFHQTTLLPLERLGQWESALETFHEMLPELGLLLTGRVGLKQEPVLQMFAYQAAVEKDRRALLDLIDVNNDPAALECIKQLLQLLGEEVSAIPAASSNTVEDSVSTMYKVIEALNNGNADTAQQLALTVDDEHLRIFLLMQIAFLSNDLTQASEVWQTFCGLPSPDQTTLRRRFPLFLTLEKILPHGMEQEATSLVLQPSSPQKQIVDWIEWFDYLAHSPNDPLLISSLKKLVNDERFWSIESVQRLNDHLLMLDEDTKRLPCVRDALQKLLIYFLKRETGFPKEDAVYQDLYELLFAALLAKTAQEEMKNNGPILLLLASTMLSSTPQKVEFVFHELQAWCDKPILKLEALALEVIEMLIDHGIEPGLLADWYREWVEQLVYRQTRYQLTSLDGWLELGRVIQPGSNLLNILQQKIAPLVAEQVTTDPIKGLPQGYCIAIYTLQEPAAQRAKLLLLRRNPSLDIQVCTDMVFSASAQALAEKSDAVVLVTTAMKHALSYGLCNHVGKEKRVFAQSSGSTGIVRGIEEFARHESSS